MCAGVTDFDSSSRGSRSRAPVADRVTGLRTATGGRVGGGESLTNSRRLSETEKTNDTPHHAHRRKGLAVVGDGCEAGR